MLNRRLSNPRGGRPLIALAAVLAAAVAVTPSFAGSFLTSQRASQLFLTNKKASKQYLTNKKASEPLPEEKGREQHVRDEGHRAAGAGCRHRRRDRPYGPTATAPPRCGLHPDRVHVVRHEGQRARGDHVLGQRRSARRRNRPLTSPARSKSWSTARKPAKSTSRRRRPSRRHPAALVQSVTLTTVLQKGGHTVAVQYLGSSKAVFTLKGWNLAVQAYPQLPKSTADRTGERQVAAFPGPSGGLGRRAAPASAGAAFFCSAASAARLHSRLGRFGGDRVAPRAALARTAADPGVPAQLLGRRLVLRLRICGPSLSGRGGGGTRRGSGGPGSRGPRRWMPGPPRRGRGWRGSGPCPPVPRRGSGP